MDPDHYWIIGQGAIFMLFIASEIIGKSKCKYTGVIDLIFGGCAVTLRSVVRRNSRENVHEEIVQV
jgi:hypothetical protein